MTTREQDQYEDRWRAFQQLERMEDHWWWRPGWRIGRSFYTWHLTFEESPELHELARQVQRELNVPGLDLVPEEGLHLTMQGIGFTDAVNTKDIDEIVAQARKRVGQLARFELTLGPVDPDAEGIGLLVAPWAEIEETRRQVRASIASVWNPENVPENETGFRPHVTVAYSTGAGDMAQIRERLASLRTVEPARVAVSQVQLIRLNRDEKVYRWDVVASVALGG